MPRDRTNTSPVEGAEWGQRTEHEQNVTRKMKSGGENGLNVAIQ